MSRLIINGPATSANVGPGYDIFALALDEPFDIIEVELSDLPGIEISVENNQTGIPLDPKKNVAGVAAQALIDRYSIKQGVKILIRKNMASGGGMGTTGASASATIFGLNKLLNLNLLDNELIELASLGEVASGGAAHVDNVAAAMLGGFVFVKSFDPLDVKKMELPEMPVVLAAMRKGQGITRGRITYDIGAEKLKEQMAMVAGVVHAVHLKDPMTFGKAISKDYIHEHVRGATIPGYWEVKKQTVEMGAFGCTVSGGGSSVITFCPKEKQDEIADYMHREFSKSPDFVRIYKTKVSNTGVQFINP